jgi:hypothetical protein
MISLGREKIGNGNGKGNGNGMGFCPFPFPFPFPFPMAFDPLSSFALVASWRFKTARSAGPRRWAGAG